LSEGELRSRTETEPGPTADTSRLVCGVNPGPMRVSPAPTLDTESSCAAGSFTASLICAVVLRGAVVSMRSVEPST
jgi:hypothetical protein